MKSLSTASFNLAISTEGDESAEYLALFLPGLLDTKDYSHIQSHLKLLAENGYYAVSFDMPGTWGSGDNIDDYTTTNCLKAINEVIEHFGNRPTLIAGHSNGGRLAVLTAVSNPVITGVISVMSAPTFIRKSNYQERAVDWKKSGVIHVNRDIPGKPGEKKDYALPYSFCENACLFDARNGIDTLGIPKLFIAGNMDTTVYPDEARETYDVALDPKDFAFIDSIHDYKTDPGSIEEVNILLFQFINSSAKNNPKGKFALRS